MASAAVKAADKAAATSEFNAAGGDDGWDVVTSAEVAVAVQEEAAALSADASLAQEIARSSIADAIAAEGGGDRLADWAYVIVTEQLWKYGIDSFHTISFLPPWWHVPYPPHPTSRGDTWQVRRLRV